MRAFTDHHIVTGGNTQRARWTAESIGKTPATLRPSTRSGAGTETRECEAVDVTHSRPRHLPQATASTRTQRTSAGYCCGFAPERESRLSGPITGCFTSRGHTTFISGFCCPQKRRHRTQARELQPTFANGLSLPRTHSAREYKRVQPSALHQHNPAPCARHPPFQRDRSVYSDTPVEAVVLTIEYRQTQ